MVIQINFNQQVDKKAIFLLFGCYCLNPRLALDEKYATNTNDYPENFHKMIWGAIINIAKKRTAEKITPIDIENEISQFDTALSLWKNNDGWGYIESAIDMSSDKISNVGKYYDDVRKYSIIRNATESLKMDISFIYDEDDDEKLEHFNQLTSIEVLNEINNKFMDFKSKWKNVFGDNYSFRAGEGIVERLNEHKNQQNVYGYPFQSGYLTTVYRGMRPKKYILRSSVSGGGKSRSSLADGCNMVSDRIYDWNKKEWIPTGESQPVLFISTELMVNVPFSELRKRAKKRGDFSTWEANYKKESEEFSTFEKSNLIDYFVLNDGDVEESIKKMENIIKRDKSKRGITDEN